MALQGTLDTFALPDVLRLLASTKKTGRLRLRGDRGDGSVWVDSGSVVAAESSGSGPDGTAVDVVFELLRFAEGSFTFDAGTTAENAGAPSDVEPLLKKAESQLVEWRDIETVVPSLDAWVVLAGDLPEAEVTLDVERWRTIVSIGSGTSVAEIGRALGLAEVAVCRRVKDIVELGLGAVLAPSVEHETAPEPELSEYEGDSHGVLEPLEPLESIEPAPWATSPSTSSVEDVPAYEPFSVDLKSPSYVEDIVVPPLDIAPIGFGPADDEAVDADEVARQLASLSPRAARAVAAAAKADTLEEREAALAGVTGEDDEPINRGLLLKFLSSVRS
ncbi:MAG: resuscitation-promoting factor RpfA [Acidimicrobiaceae bacterium]